MTLNKFVITKDGKYLSGVSEINGSLRDKGFLHVIVLTDDLLDAKQYTDAEAILIAELLNMECVPYERAVESLSLFVGFNLADAIEALQWEWHSLVSANRKADNLTVDIQATAKGFIRILLDGELIWHGKYDFNSNNKEDVKEAIVRFNLILTDPV